MASPFNIFRRNQRMMMVVLTGLSMIAFLFFDATTMRSGGVPKSLTVVFFAALCGLGLWFVGSRRGQGSEWAMWGAALGAVAAFLFVRSAGPEPVIQGKGIQVTETQLRKLAERRMKVNRFVFEAAKVTKAARPAQGFGGFDDRSMVQFVMGREEAKRLGIKLTDAAVNRYLREITEDKLSKREFSEILRDLGIGESDLFNYLKDELEVRLALSVQAPPYDSWLDFNFQARQSFYQPMLRATPEELWQTFRRLNVKESIAAVQLPVDSFVAKVDEPADAEVRALFEAAKGKVPGVQGDPGFLQPHRVQLAYLSADFNKFESQAEPPTEDEIAEYYEQNKARYAIRDFPDDLDLEGPVDAMDPENVLPAFPAPDEPSQESPDDEAPADAAPEKAPAPSTEPESTPEKSSNDGAAADHGPTSPFRLVSLTTQSEDESTESSKAPSEDGKTEVEETGENTSEETPERPQREGGDLDDPFPVDLPSPGGSEQKPVRYRDLDEDLREEIRIEILRDRTFVKMGEAVDKAQKRMEELSGEYSTADEAAQKELAKSFAETLKEYGVDHGLTYVETDLLSETELQVNAKEPIGSAMLATENTQQFQVMTVLDDLFPRGGVPGPSYVPQRADSRLRTQRYAYWKIQDVPQHEPRWDDEGIKSQVTAAWKFMKARELAMQRAETLLELAKQKPDDLSAALSGQTITGEPGTAGIVIKETPRFSWLTTESTAPMDFSMGDFMAPRLSYIEGIDQQGEDFMRKVFEELQVGEIGIAMNYPRSAVYLVQVRERDAAEPVQDDVEDYQTLDDLREKYQALFSSDRGLGFSARAYNLLMTNAFHRLQQEWVKSFDDRYGIEMDQADPAQPGSRRQPRKSKAL